MNPVENVERRIEQLQVTTRTETDRRILDDAYVALRRGVEMQSPGIWRIIAASRMARPVAAAAVILIAASLYLSMSSGSSDTVAEFYKTLGGVKNACAASYNPGQTDPFQQVWTSENQKVRLFKTGVGDRAHFALLDIDNKLEMTIYLETVQTEPLTEQKLAEMEKSMTLSSALTPFSQVEDVPQRARWVPVSDPAILAVIPGTLVYDLIWVSKVSISEEKPHKRWRVFVDADTHLPRRAEFYSKSESEEEFTFERFVIVTYPSEGEIRDIVANTFGSPGSRTDGPEHMGTPGTDR